MSKFYMINKNTVIFQGIKKIIQYDILSEIPTNIFRGN